MPEDRTGRTVRLPYDFGDTVYHRARTENVPGLVTGFLVRQNRLLILVIWGDTLTEGSHSFFELSTEYQPVLTAES